jgi:hypothetical protein
MVMLSATWRTIAANGAPNAAEGDLQLLLPPEADS